MSLRVHRIPFSTNVERVALACAHKGVVVEWVDHEAEDRSAIRALSGQDLVPVAETRDGVIGDSAAILAWLDRVHPEPPLWPHDPSRRAEADVFVEWFNRVWKRAANALVEREDSRAEAELAGWLERFEALLGDRPFLLGDELGIADIVAFPFLKYPVLGLAPDDTHPEWVARVNAYPRA